MNVYWPGNWWALAVTGAATQATNEALAAFRAQLGGPAGMQALAQQYAQLKANNPLLAEQIAQALGVNIHAAPNVGEAYESSQLGLPSNFVAGPGPDFEADPTGNTPASLTSPGVGRPTRHAWAQHIGAVVAMSAGNRVTLENYARSHEQGAMRRARLLFPDVRARYYSKSDVASCLDAGGRKRGSPSNQKRPDDRRACLRHINSRWRQSSSIISISRARKARLLRSTDLFLFFLHPETQAAKAELVAPVPGWYLLRVRPRTSFFPCLPAPS